MEKPVMAKMHQGQLVAQHREYMGMSQQDLADEMKLSLRTVQRLEKEAVIEDRERRRFLVGLLGIPAVLMGLEQEEAQPIRKARLLLNDDRMAFYEEQLDARWNMLYIGGPLYALAGWDGWLKEMNDFAQAAQGTAWRTRSLSVLCMSYQLKQGAIRDLRQYDEASRAGRQALRIAEELNDPELKASALLREGTTFMRQEKMGEAIEYYQGAHDVIKGYGFPNLRGNILQILSVAYAKAQRSQECWRCIGLAENVLQQQGEIRERSQRVFTAASIIGGKGISALLLHDYERARTLLDKSLIAYPLTMMPKRASLTAYKAEAYYGMGEIDICTATAEEAWKLASSVGAKEAIGKVEKLHATMEQSRWGKERCVRRLGALITTSKAG